MRARVRDLLDDAWPLDLLAVLELVLKHGITRRCHGNLVHSSFRPPNLLIQKIPIAGRRASGHATRSVVTNSGGQTRFPGFSPCRRNSSAARAPRGLPRDRA